MKFFKTFTLSIVFAALSQAGVFGTLSSLQRFPVYQTCPEASKAGVPCPMYDPTQPVKSWVDATPPEADREGNVRYLTICLARDRRTPAVRDGKPFLCEFTMPVDEARRLNIPPKDFTGKIAEPMQMYERPVPLRGLLPDEELYFGFGGLPMVKKATPTSGSGDIILTGMGSARIEELLETLLAKIEILLATAGK